MKKFFSCLLVSLFCLFTTSSCVGPSKMPNAQLVRHAGKSTVALVYYGHDSDVPDTEIHPFCSGVWVDDTHILTAYHCVKAMQKHEQQKQDAREAAQKAKNAACEGMELLFGMCDPDAVVPHKEIELDGLGVHFIQQAEVDQMGTEPTAWHLSRVASWDFDHDLALLKATGRAVPAHEIAELADEVPATGEFVMAVGHPKGFYWTFLKGTVAGCWETTPAEDSKAPYLQVQIPIFHGSSGGGVFNAYGQLVAIVDSMPGLPAEGLCIPVVSIRDFLKAHRSMEALHTLKIGR